MTVWLATGGYPRVPGMLGLGLLIGSITLSGLAVATVLSGEYLLGLSVFVLLALPVMGVFWIVAPVRIGILPSGIRLGWRWIPRNELYSCEIQGDGPHAWRLLIRSAGGDWRSPVLEESRSKLEFVVAVVQLIMRPANSMTDLAGPRGAATD